MGLELTLFGTLSRFASGIGFKFLFINQILIIMTNKTELRLMYQKDTGHKADEIKLEFQRFRGDFKDDHSKPDDDPEPIHIWAADEDTEDILNLNVSCTDAEAWFSMPNPDYFEWLEEKIIELLSK